MAIIQSCCCWRSLRRGCYAAALYTVIYFLVTLATMAHFVDEERRYIAGEMSEPESESFLEPEKITWFTVILNIALLVCSVLGFVSCFLMAYGIYKDLKYMLLPWILVMVSETLIDLINMVYLLYLQSMNFNPITSFLFTMDFFVVILNLYSMVCVISQFQEYIAGRGTASFEQADRVATVQYTAAVPQTTTTSGQSARRRSATRSMPSRYEPEEPSEMPTKVISSVLAKTHKSTVKKHVQFPDEQSCLEGSIEIPAPIIEEKPESRVISSLWMELESQSPAPER